MSAPPATTEAIATGAAKIGSGEGPHHSHRTAMQGPSAIPSRSTPAATTLQAGETAHDKRFVTGEKRNYSTNFFEVFIRNSKSDFSLTLEGEREKNDVWECTNRADECQNKSTYHEQAGQHFVYRHWSALINRVSSTNSILDILLEKQMISQESYDTIRSRKPSQKQMRGILKVVTAGGRQDDFVEILRRVERSLMAELDASQ
ncbi:uncharacterized protein LOC121639349 [Melanotaenia boesemani]|uniref:uncharacterized protein LOC121639349 n=1 Tax=Melanotaenia boesemani TaxID=1250792 RepID=UPI001C05A284|nr:uncharacterized protein LOC121639349 [Melanotaenia boesemani]